MQSILMVTMLCVGLASCSKDGGGDDATVETTLTVSAQSFNLSGSGDDSKSLTIKSNVQWTISSVESWLHCSQYSGTGEVTISVFADANMGTKQRTGFLTITAGEKSKTVQVIQAADGSPTPEQTCGTKPTEVLRFSDSFVTNYVCDDDVKFFYAGIYPKTTLDAVTEAELKKDLRESGTRRSAVQAKYPVYTLDLDPFTAYTLVTLSYDKNDKERDLVKYNITTKGKTSQPEVEFSDLDLTGDGNYLYWKITAQKGSNGYCSKFYTWIASGTNMTSMVFPPQAICWYLAKEIKSNPSAHKTDIHASLDDYVRYVTGTGASSFASDVTEYLDGPKTQETATTTFRGMPNPEGVYLVFWGMDDTGELSGKVTGGYIDLTESNDAPQRMSASSPYLLWQRKTYEADKYSLIPLLK